MHGRNVIYRRLTSRMALLGLTHLEVAKMMEMSYSTFHHKLCGETAFTLDEAIRLKRLLSMPEGVEEAFERFQPVGGSAHASSAQH